MLGRLSDGVEVIKITSEYSKSGMSGIAAKTTLFIVNKKFDALGGIMGKVGFKKTGHAVSLAGKHFTNFLEQNSDI